MKSGEQERVREEVTAVIKKNKSCAEVFSRLPPVPRARIREHENTDDSARKTRFFYVWSRSYFSPDGFVVECSRAEIMKDSDIPEQRLCAAVGLFYASCSCKADLCRLRCVTELTVTSLREAGDCR